MIHHLVSECKLASFLVFCALINYITVSCAVLGSQLSSLCYQWAADLVKKKNGIIFSTQKKTFLRPRLVWGHYMFNKPLIISFPINPVWKCRKEEQAVFWPTELIPCPYVICSFSCLSGYVENTILGHCMYSKYMLYTVHYFLFKKNRMWNSALNLI